MKRSFCIFSFALSISFYSMAMESPPEPNTKSGSSIGSLTPRTSTKQTFEREISKISSRPTSPTRQARMQFFEEQKNNLANPNTENNSIQLALLIRAAEKGEERYTQVTYDKSELWGNDSILIKAARFWAYAASPTLPKDGLGTYDSAALLVRQNGESNHDTREKVVQDIFEFWKILYELEKTRRDRIIDDPSLRTDEAPSAAVAAHAADALKKQGSGRFTIRRLKTGSNSNSGSSTPTGQHSPH